MILVMKQRKDLKKETEFGNPPLFNFTSYLNLSSSFAAFTSHLSSVEIPKNVQQALEVPKWKEAALD